MSAFTIGGLAREVGVGVESIRFYQRKGLLEEPGHQGRIDHSLSLHAPHARSDLAGGCWAEWNF